MPPYYFTLTAALTNGGGEFYGWSPEWRRKAAQTLLNKIHADKEVDLIWSQYYANNPTDYTASFVNRGR